MDSDDDEIPMLVGLDEPQEHQENLQHGQTTAPVVGKQFERPVPVTLITGYLGAGKSTLVQNILTDKHGFRVAVILNEVGIEKGIEKAMLKDEAGQVATVNEWVELTNGCLCCSVKDDFVNALESLMLQQTTFDYILIETTGLADPGPVAAALWTDVEVEAGVVLDCIVTVVDAKNIRRQLAGNRAVSPKSSLPRRGAAHKANGALDSDARPPNQHPRLPGALGAHDTEMLQSKQPAGSAPAQPQHLQDSSTLPADVHYAVPSHSGPGFNHDLLLVDHAADVCHSADTSAPHSEPSSAAPHLVHTELGGARPPPLGDHVCTLDDMPSTAASITHHSQPQGSTAHEADFPAVNEAQKQVAYADVILLNKTDLVSDSDLAAVRESLRKHNSAAEVVTCLRSGVPLERILNTGAYRGLTAALDVPSIAQSVPEDTCGHCEHHTHGEEGQHHHCCDHEGSGMATQDPLSSKIAKHSQHISHDPDVSTVTLRLAEPVSLEGFKTWMDTLLWLSASTVDIFRIKGLLSVKASNIKHGVQAVHELYEVVEGGQWDAGEHRSTRIIVIGRWLNEASLMSSLRAACFPS